VRNDDNAAMKTEELMHDAGALAPILRAQLHGNIDGLLRSGISP
jgi:hypothetical protein